MQLFLYFCFIYLFKSTQANSPCDEIITPITEWNPYSLPDKIQPTSCKTGTVRHGHIYCNSTAREPFVLTFKNYEQTTRLGCYVYSDKKGIVGKVNVVEIGIDTLSKHTDIWQIRFHCNLRKSILKLVTNATKIRLEFRTQSDISLYCIKMEDDPKIFHAPSKEVDSSEKGIGPKKHCDCGRSKKISSNRIINGTNVASIKEYPWMVSLQKINYTTGYFDHQCGGSIITRRHVITAAHCVEECERNCGRTYVVKIGSTRTEFPHGKIIRVKNVVIHEKYDPEPIHNDIAILELASKIPKNKYMPICIPNEFLPSKNQQLTTLGWGNMGIPDTRREMEQLKKAHVRLLDLAICKKLFRLKFLKDSQICSYSKHSSVANGDSGGPWMYVDPKTNRYNLVGISSYMTQLMDFAPGVQTAVHHYYDWITENIESGISGDDDKCNISL